VYLTKLANQCYCKMTWMTNWITSYRSYEFLRLLSYKIQATDLSSVMLTVLVIFSAVQNYLRIACRAFMTIDRQRPS
jgi:hypothetical protein